MAASLLPNGKQQFSDINGKPLVGGTVGMYIPNTLVPKDTWQDATQTILNTNPIILDSRGQAMIYGFGTYRQIVRDLLGNLIWDEITSGNGGGSVVFSIDSIADLRALGATSPLFSPINVLNYYAGVPGGGGVFYWDSASVLSDNGGTIIKATGVTTGRWIRQFSGPLDITWFGAVGDGVFDSTTAIQNTINTGQTVYVPSGNFLATNTLTITTPWQQITGSGKNTSTVTFSLGSSGIGIDIQPSGGIATENVGVIDIHLNGASNVNKLINLGGPQAQILRNRLVNSTPTGSVIWFQDEDAGTGVYCFGARILLNKIFGSLSGGTNGGIGIYLGTNSQTTSVCFNDIENNGIHFFLNGATSQLTVFSNLFQRSDDTQAAVIINKTASSMPCNNVLFDNNYFEQNHKCFSLDNADFHNLRITNNFATRNTTTPKISSAFYITGSNTSADSNGLWVENNCVDDFNSIFDLNGNEYGASRLVSTKGNTLSNTDNWAVGTFSDYAFETRVTNPFFQNGIVTGAIASSSVTRTETVTATYQVPIQVSDHEILQYVKFLYVPVGGGDITATLFSLDSSVSSPTPIQIGTPVGPTSVGGYLQIPVEGVYGRANTQYYVEIATSGGTSNFVYPLTLYLRQ